MGQQQFGCTFAQRTIKPIICMAWRRCCSFSPTMVLRMVKKLTMALAKKKAEPELVMTKSERPVCATSPEDPGGEREEGGE